MDDQQSGQQQQQQQPRYWFPYWTNQPLPAQPPVHPQLSRRDSRAPPSSPSPSLTPSQSRRLSQDAPQESSLSPRQQPAPSRPIARPTPAAVLRSPPSSKGAPQPSKTSQSKAPLAAQQESPSEKPNEQKPKPMQEIQPQLDHLRTNPAEPDHTAERKPKPEDIQQEKTMQEPNSTPCRPIELKTSPQASPLQAKEKQETKKEVLHQVDEKPKEIVEEPKRIVVEKKMPTSDPNPKSATPETEATQVHGAKKITKHADANGASSSHGEHAELHKEIKAGITNLMQKINTLQTRRSLGHEKGTNIITLAGENKGASMQVGHENAKKESASHKINDNKAEGGKGAAKLAGITAMINSNVQSINNSLLFQSSCSEGDPGVHLKLSSKSKKKEKRHGGGGDEY